MKKDLKYKLRRKVAQFIKKIAKVIHRLGVLVDPQPQRKRK